MLPPQATPFLFFFLLFSGPSPVSAFPFFSLFFFSFTHSCSGSSLARPRPDHPPAGPRRVHRALQPAGSHRAPSAASRCASRRARRRRRRHGADFDGPAGGAAFVGDGGCRRGHGGGHGVAGDVDRCVLRRARGLQARGVLGWALGRVGRVRTRPIRKRANSC